MSTNGSGRPGVPRSAEERASYELGAIHRDLTTIFRRIRHRRSGEPTATERLRIADLQTSMRKIRAGDYPAEWKCFIPENTESETTQQDTTQKD